MMASEHAMDGGQFADDIVAVAHNQLGRLLLWENFKAAVDK